MNGTEVEHFAETFCHPGNSDGYKDLWLQVSLNFTDNSPRLYVTTVYLAKADERIILHCWSCAKEGREFELCKYLETAKRHIFGNHRIEFGPLLSTILPLSRPHRVANHFLFSSQV